MKVNLLLVHLIQYITEAFARIFSATDDQYPLVGVQPFEGDPYQS
jgi:hypothetical protein